MAASLLGGLGYAYRGAELDEWWNTRWPRGYSTLLTDMRLRCYATEKLTFF